MRQPPRSALFTRALVDAATTRPLLNSLLALKRAREATSPSQRPAEGPPPRDPCEDASRAA